MSSYRALRRRGLDQRKARVAGFDQHLAKPFDFRAVEEVVASATAAPARATGK
jgi:hypothetical protein